MGKSQPSTQTVINKTELPEWVQTAAKENLALANQLGSRPYTPYEGSLVAGFSPAQKQAQEMVSAMAGSTAPAFSFAQQQAAEASQYQPSSVQASGPLSYGDVAAQDVTAGTLPGTDLSQYMNPYIQNVEDRAIANAQRALRGSLADIGAKASQAGAFGGSRQGILEGVATSEAARNIGDLSAQLRQQGFTTAAGLAQTDLNRALEAARANQAAGLQAQTTNQAAALQAGQFGATQALEAQRLNQLAGLQGAQQQAAAAGLLGSLTTAGQTAAMNEAEALQQIGLQQQGLKQRQLEDAYARSKEELDYPTQMLNLRLASLGATPYGQSSTQTRTGFESTSPMLGGIGSFLSGIGAIASL